MKIKLTRPHKEEYYVMEQLMIWREIMGSNLF